LFAGLPFGVRKSTFEADSFFYMEEGKGTCMLQSILRLKSPLSFVAGKAR